MQKNRLMGTFTKRKTNAAGTRYGYAGIILADTFLNVAIFMVQHSLISGGLKKMNPEEIDRSMRKDQIEYQLKTFGLLNVNEFNRSDIFHAFCKHMASERLFLDAPTTVMRWYVYQDAWNSCAAHFAKILSNVHHGNKQ